MRAPPIRSAMSATRTVSVQVTSVVRASDRVVPGQVDRERLSSAAASPAPSHWTAILSVVVRPPASAETLRKNPLGLYVDAIDWSQELETTAPAPRRRRSAQPPPAPALRFRSARRSSRLRRLAAPVSRYNKEQPMIRLVHARRLGCVRRRLPAAAVQRRRQAQLALVARVQSDRVVGASARRASKRAVNQASRQRRWASRADRRR